MTGATADRAGSASGGASLVVGPALVVDQLDVTYRVRGRDRLALRNVSFEIGRTESYGLVGESGSGKSTIALALTRYLPRNGRVSAGSISINGADPMRMGSAALRNLRARTVSMVYQEPGKALNPSIKAGRQVAEVYEVAGLSRDDAMDRAAEMLAKVQIPDPRRVMERYPHQLSGGMAQRVVIAMAIAADPSLLILDEPTTALDATVEAEVLDLIAGLRAELNTSLLFISHNLAVIAKMCDRVGVLYAGELIEEGPADRGLQRAPPPVHGRAAALHPAPWPAQGPRPAGLDPRLPAAAWAHAARLHLHPALPDRRGPLPRGATACLRRRTGPDFPLLPARGDRGPAAQHPGGRRAADRPGGRQPAGHHLQGRLQDLCLQRRVGAGAARGEPRRAARRDARSGRRVRQRQDHAGAGAARPHRAGRGLGRRAQRLAACRPTSATAAAISCRPCRSCSRTRTRR